MLWKCVYLSKLYKIQCACRLAYLWKSGCAVAGNRRAAAAILHRRPPRFRTTICGKRDKLNGMSRLCCGSSCSNPGQTVAGARSSGSNGEPWCDVSRRTHGRSPAARSESGLGEVHGDLPGVGDVPRVRLLLKLGGLEREPFRYGANNGLDGDLAYRSLHDVPQNLLGH